MENIEKYVCPMDLLGGRIKKGTIYVLENEGYYFKPIGAIGSQGKIPPEIVRTWEKYQEPKEFTDSQKLRTLAMWFDTVDSEKWHIGKGGEVQQDLRRIADNIESKNIWGTIGVVNTEPKEITEADLIVGKTVLVFKNGLEERMVVAKIKDDRGVYYNLGGCSVEPYTLSFIKDFFTIKNEAL